MARRKLTEKEIQTALEELTDWAVVDGKLHKAYKFGSFAQAIGWMVSVALFADKTDHHPEWRNVYNRVWVDLATHDLDDAISELDVKLARQMDKLAG
ncbi:putative pterin-4-alpha-carbinolamine dehydratase [Candidatus Promineifilum breve]|uniref:Putative pterin-4-alpha-carbinolamine dehydratase n=1 Tax=Candidatus Promineifilum breve TaxID=1806508 RepID=A0A160T5S5_9CHLR|nr:4a-hydroxytetrahydrobiopterin dehydratase [Candidatus Promineifilum breve]CUS05294.2 putative pterin-4-alpha-carbinolamine dehydratase [Candidatus Promineifilum breve]